MQRPLMRRALTPKEKEMDETLRKLKELGGR
jgi:hypothetical protein